MALAHVAPEMVIGALGILKAGAAYMPLDPSFPSERLAVMLEEYEPLAVLTRGDRTPMLDGRIKSVDLLRDLLRVNCGGGEQDGAKEQP